jgi:hypothetical protein
MDETAREQNLASGAPGPVTALPRPRLHVLLVMLGFALLLGGGVGLVFMLQQRLATPTAAEYLAHADHTAKPGPADAAKLVPAGALQSGGASFKCGRFPTILNASLDDYGAAYFGFILLNPVRFESLPLILKRYAYAHECGHQYVGYDEGEADCFAIRRGRAEGWLGEPGLDAICNFIGLSRGDGVHALGLRRCEMMRRCFARARPGREKL